MRVGGQHQASAARNDQIPILWEAGWALGPVWRGEENLAHIGIWSPNCPAHSKYLYWLQWLVADARIKHKFVTNSEAKCDIYVTMD
jgi:hypothetical protein